MSVCTILSQGTNISDADAAVGDVKDGLFFYSVEEPIKEGTMPTVAITAGGDTYPTGYHAGDAGGLDAIDTDLIAANIVEYANGNLVEGEGFFLSDDVIQSRLFTPVNSVPGHDIISIFIFSELASIFNGFI